MNKLATRTISGAVYVLIVIGSIYAGSLLARHNSPYLAHDVGNFIFTVIFFIIGLIGIHEVNANLRRHGDESNRGLAYAIGIITFWIEYIWLNGRNLINDHVAFSMTAALLPALAMVVFLVQLWREDKNPFASIGYTLLPSIWVMTPMALMTHIHSESAGLMMMVFILIWVNDSFAYLTGMLIGRHKMWERHSPNKTWEGTAGGLLFCIVAAMVFGPLFDTQTLAFTRTDWLVTALICSILGTLGDLVESMFKRYCGVKDSGTIMPGHGGILDRFDSMLMSAPFVAAYIVILQL